MQVLPEYANIGTASQPPSSSLPTTTTTATNNTSPVLPSSSAPERRPNASSPHLTTDDGRRADDEGVVVAARHVRRESAASVGVPAGPPSSSQPVEFTVGPSASLCRSNSSVGFFANRLHASTGFQPVRRSPDSYRYDEAPCRARKEPWLTISRHEFMPAHRPSSAAPGSVLPPPQSSKYRLSMSVEGKAELVSQPSPPRLSPSALSDSFVAPDRPQLYRSHSAADSITLPPISTFAAPFEEATQQPGGGGGGAPPASQSQPQAAALLLQPQPRLPPRGLYRSRSRDVHAWELACESNSGEHRDELTAYAERESSGSAIAAISLLRTLSSSSHHPSPIIGHHHHPVFQSNTTKRNARPSAQHHHIHQHYSSSSSHHHAKKPRLNRAASSVARLQNNYAATDNNINKASSMRQRLEGGFADGDEDVKKAKIAAGLLLSSGGNDSDKENWSPSDFGPRTTFHSSQQRPPTTTGRRPLPSAPLSKPTPSASAPAANSSRRRVLEDGTNRFLLGRASTAPTGRRKKATVPIEIFEDAGDYDKGSEADASEDDDDDEDEDEDEQVGRRRFGAAADDDDDEVEKFMRGEGVSPGKRGAASAIAGLLALSQGAWR